MIAKVKLLSSITNLISYIFNPKEGQDFERAQHIVSNYCGECPKDIIRDWERYMDNGKTRLKNNCMHVVFSLSPGETMTDDQYRIFLDEIVTPKMGLQNFAYTAVRHLDTSSHEHIHLAILRRSPITGKTLSDRNSYYKTMACARAAEERFNLRKVKNPWEENNFRDSRKVALKDKIKASLSGSYSIEEFKLKLMAEGISTKMGRGIVFIDENGMITKGSDRQIKYPLSKIKQIIDDNKSIQRNQDDVALKKSEPCEQSKSVEIENKNFSLAYEINTVTINLLNGLQQDIDKPLPELKPKTKKQKKQGRKN